MFYDDEPADQIHSTRVTCPHCASHIHLEVDTSGEDQQYEDECNACGEIIYVRLYRSAADNKFHLEISADDEQYY